MSVLCCCYSKARSSSSLVKALVNAALVSFDWLNSPCTPSVREKIISFYVFRSVFKLINIGISDGISVFGGFFIRCFQNEVKKACR